MTEELRICLRCSELLADEEPGPICDGCTSIVQAAAAEPRQKLEDDITAAIALIDNDESTEDVKPAILQAAQKRVEERQAAEEEAARRGDEEASEGEPLDLKEN